MRGNTNTDGDDGGNLAKEFAMLREEGGDNGVETLDKTADVVDFKCNNSSSNGGPLRVVGAGSSKAIRSFEAET